MVAMLIQKCKSKNSLKLLLFCWILSFLKICHSRSTEDKDSRGKILPKAATFHFPEYAYKETSKNELTYHEFEIACSNHAACMHLDGVQKKSCIRRCISQSCYQDIYAFDELEEGEIDVRLNSFKGCVIQRTTSSHRL